MIFNALLRGLLKLTDPLAKYRLLAPILIVGGGYVAYLVAKDANEEREARRLELIENLDARKQAFQRMLNDPECQDPGMVMAKPLAWSEQIFVQACCTMFVRYSTDLDQRQRPPVQFRFSPVNVTGRYQYNGSVVSDEGQPFVFRHKNPMRPGWIKFGSQTEKLAVSLSYSFEKDETCTPAR